MAMTVRHFPFALNISAGTLVDMVDCAVWCHDAGLTHCKPESCGASAGPDAEDDEPAAPADAAAVQQPAERDGGGGASPMKQDPDEALLQCAEAAEAAAASAATPATARVVR